MHVPNNLEMAADRFANGQKLLVSLLLFVHSPAAKLTYAVNSRILLFGGMTDCCYVAWGGGINTSDVRFDTTNTHNNQPFHLLEFLVSLLFFILSPTAKLTYTVNNHFSKSLHPPQVPIPNSSQRVGQIVAVIFAPSIERIGLTPFNGGPVVPFPLCVLFRCKQRREKEVEDGFNFVS